MIDLLTDYVECSTIILPCRLAILNSYNPIYDSRFNAKPVAIGQYAASFLGSSTYAACFGDAGFPCLCQPAICGKVNLPQLVALSLFRAHGLRLSFSVLL